ncbi:MAG: signal recognition particle protein, partial [Bifidobacterium sp.]|nr:signal recognition particle protein [Bifidobacterium sp.]
MKREAEEKALRDRLAGKGGGSAFAKKPQNPALPAGLQDMLGENGMPDVPPNLGGGLGGLFGR